MTPYRQFMSSLSRRDFLRFSAVGAAAASMSGWIHPLAAGAAEAGIKDRACIVVWLAGGLSQMESFDVKEYSVMETRPPP